MEELKFIGKHGSFPDFATTSKISSKFFLPDTELTHLTVTLLTRKKICKIEQRKQH